MPFISGGGGGGGPAAGKYLPVSYPTGATVDTTTYVDPATGNPTSTLVFPASGANEATCFLCVALAGDTKLRWGFSSDPVDFGIYIGDGASASMGSISLSGGQLALAGRNNAAVFGPTATHSYTYPQLGQLSPKFSITSGALPTVTITSGTGRQISTSGDVETVTPFSGDGTNNAATCLIQLSPDNVTYSTLVTESIAAALNLTGVLTITANVRVPAGWYIKLTATHGTLGTTTYY